MSVRTRVAAALVAVATASLSCGSGPVEGADVDRPDDAATDLVRFENVAQEIGLSFRHGAFRWATSPDPSAMMGGGLCWIDYDDDGWMDLFVVNTWSDREWGRWRKEGSIPTSRLFRNERGRFVDVTDDTGAGVESRGNGCVAADLDLDGRTDLYVTTQRDNVLLWNEGDGFVADDGASGTAAYGWHAGAAVGDVNGDGLPDLFVAGYADLNRPVAGTTKGFPNPFTPESDHLFVNEGAAEGGRPTFRDVAESAGIEPGGAQYGLGALFSDVDLDGDLDLYVANDTQPNQLYVNETPDGADASDVRFVERGAAAGVDDPNAGMGVASGDFDGNGRPDLVVTNLGDQRHAVFAGRTGSDGPDFDDAREDIGVPDPGRGDAGWGTMWGDLDLDTDLDLVFVHGAIPVTDLTADREDLRAYANGLGAGTGRFADVTATWGLDAAGPLVARGAALADVDNDGDLDIAVGTIGGDVVLLRNRGAGGHWLIVDPEPRSPGTVLTATLADGTTMRRELMAGSSYLSSEDPRLHLGLGSETTVARLTVEWPDGTRAELDDVAGDRILRVSPD